MHIQAAARTDVGKKRDQNEDTFVLAEALGLLGVCDGMGGHAAGEIASAVAREAAVRIVRHRPWVRERALEPTTPAEPLMALLDQAIEAANADVFALGSENLAYTGMGCTLTLLLTAGSRAALASVGDSRMYRVRGGEAHQLTIDHTMGEEMRKAGLTGEQLAGYRYGKLLSRAVGFEAVVRADTFLLDLEVGDRLVLCTDGLSDYIESDAWLAGEVEEGSAAEVADRLVSFANAAGGRDNITVVVGIVTA